MANTTARIIIESADLLSDPLDLDVTGQLNQAGVTTGLVGATGIGRKNTLSTSEYTIFAAASFTDNTAAKVYLKNTSIIATEHFIIKHGTQVLGRLYAGDWAFYPWDGAADIKITPSVSTLITLEHCLFTDEPTS
tara:strand:+ start:119 stop:523 length:405 start_codon:yes stop_codon:yes gene_type:complete